MEREIVICWSLLRDIRLSALDGSGRSTLVNFFIVLGIIILVLAWFNYINLYTAGLRKG